MCRAAQLMHPLHDVALLQVAILVLQLDDTLPQPLQLRGRRLRLHLCGWGGRRGGEWAVRVGKGESPQGVCAYGCVIGVRVGGEGVTAWRVVGLLGGLS